MKPGLITRLSRSLPYDEVPLAYDEVPLGRQVQPTYDNHPALIDLIGTVLALGDLMNPLLMPFVNPVEHCRASRAAIGESHEGVLGNPALHE
jgi:hypothetical protein